MNDPYIPVSYAIRALFAGIALFSGYQYINLVSDPSSSAVIAATVTAFCARMALTPAMAPNTQTLERAPQYLRGIMRKKFDRQLQRRETIRPFARRLIVDIGNYIETATINLQGHHIFIEEDNGVGRFRNKFLRSSVKRQPFTVIYTTGKNQIIIEYSLWDKTPVTVKIPDKNGGAISETLSGEEAALFLERLKMWQILRFCEILECPPDEESLSTTIALLIEGDHNSLGAQRITGSGSGITYIHFDISQEITTADGRQGWLYHPDIGCLRLLFPTIDQTVIYKREHQFLAAFDNTVETFEKIPPMIGNPSLAKEISVAQKLIARYPDMKDASGTPISPLVKEHLPRLVRRHSEAIDAATASNNIDQDLLDKITNDFESGLAVISRAVLEGVEMEQRRTSDDLSVEIAFLSARHPEQTPLSSNNKFY